MTMASSSAFKEHVMAVRRLRTRNSGAPIVDDAFKTRLRLSIIREEHLRQFLERDEDLKRSKPAVWQMAEEFRLRLNRERTETNRRLRAAGLELQSMEPSLGRRRQSLQRLARENCAALAILKAESRKIPAKRAGKPLA